VTNHNAEIMMKMMVKTDLRIKRRKSTLKPPPSTAGEKVNDDLS